MRIKCSNIKWETDGADISLPDKVLVEVVNNTDEEVANALSEKVGWLVNNFTKEEVD